MCEFHQPTTVSFSIMTTDERVGRGEKPNFPNSKRTEVEMLWVTADWLETMMSLSVT